MLTTRLACKNTSSPLPSIGTHASEEWINVQIKPTLRTLLEKPPGLTLKIWIDPVKLAFCCLITLWVSNCGDIMNKMPLFWWSAPTAEAEKHHMTRSSKEKNHIKLGEETRLFAPSTFPSRMFSLLSSRVVRTEDNTFTQASPSLNPATVQSCLVPRSPPPWILKRMHAYPVGIFPLFLRFSFLPLSPRLSLPPPPPSHIGVLWLKRSRTD